VGVGRGGGGGSGGGWIRQATGWRLTDTSAAGRDGVMGARHHGSHGTHTTAFQNDHTTATDAAHSARCQAGVVGGLWASAILVDEFSSAQRSRVANSLYASPAHSMRTGEPTTNKARGGGGGGRKQGSKARPTPARCKPGGCTSLREKISKVISAAAGRQGACASECLN